MMFAMKGANRSCDDDFLGLKARRRRSRRRRARGGWRSCDGGGSAVAAGVFV
ncbi:hypothetical protein LR48_Vigan03g315800 [Vigna angularis]|uniref:Uncharacterized protein n=1 Tax=Phaseolus angularis TaxID=3914 RepID=A0A0L9UAN9_PHAAN|nr:hypothetical protein LR48_Vigan03g315800 [Vigna angularis]